MRPWTCFLADWRSGNQHCDYCRYALHHFRNDEQEVLCINAPVCKLPKQLGYQRPPFGSLRSCQGGDHLQLEAYDIRHPRKFRFSRQSNLIKFYGLWRVICSVHLSFSLVLSKRVYQSPRARTISIGVLKKISLWITSFIKYHAIV